MAVEEPEGPLTKLRRDALATIRGWWNPATGKGDPARDKRAGMLWAGGVRMQHQHLRSLFDYSDLAHTIVTALPEWGLRHGWQLQLDAPSAGDDASPAREAQTIRRAVRSEEKRLGLAACVQEAATWGQLFGGGLILIGAVDGRPSSEPLDESTLQEIEWLRVVDRTEVVPVDVDDDPGSPRFGEPDRYEVQEHGASGGSARSTWHHSRVVRFGGTRTSRRTRRENLGWDLSVLDRVVAKLSLHDGIWDDVGAMMADGSQGVWKIKGLMQSIRAGRREDVEARFELADQTRSLFRSILLDTDGEEFDFRHRQFSGFDGLLAQSAIRTSAAAQMPVTVLFGQSPAGMNATGESDIRLWYDRVETYQSDKLEPGVARLTRLLFLAKNGPTRGVEPEGWSVQFPPVRQPTSQERTNERHQQAQTDLLYHDMGVLDPETIAAARFGPHGWSPDTVVDPTRLEEPEPELDDPELDDPEPEPEREPEREPAPEPADPDAERKDPQSALNGAQVSAMQGIVNAVAAGEIPRATGVALMTLAFPISAQQAEEAMGVVGTDAWTPRAAAPAPSPPPPPTPPTPEPPLPPEEE